MLNSLSHSLPLLVFGILNNLTSSLALLVSMYGIVCLSVLSPFTRVWVPCSNWSVFFQTLFCVCNQISIICLVLSDLFCRVHVPSAISLQPVSVRVPCASLSSLSISGYLFRVVPGLVCYPFSLCPGSAKFSTPIRVRVSCSEMYSCTAHSSQHAQYPGLGFHRTRISPETKQAKRGRWITLCSFSNRENSRKKDSSCRNVV